MLNILLGICANVLTLVIGVGLAWAWHLSVGRRKLMRFFGVASSERKVRIFIGNLQAQGVPRGYVGFEESFAARRLQGLFQSLIPGASNFSTALGFLRLADIDAEVVPAMPGDPSIILDQSSISIGSNLSNQASAMIERDLKSPVHSDTSGAFAIVIPNLEPIRSPYHGVLVKLCRNGKCFFYAFGAAEYGSAGAAHYLVNNWRVMQKKYGNEVQFYYLIDASGGAQTAISVADHKLI